MMITQEQQNAFAAFGQTLDQPQPAVDLSQLIPAPIITAPILFTVPNDPKYGWLHPQFPSAFKGTKGGQQYFSADQYYCEKKAILAKDDVTRQKIMAVQCQPIVNNQFDWTAVSTAHGEIQTVTRAMTTLNPTEWLKFSVQIMRQALTYKFCQDETLFKLLMETGEAYVIYASAEDFYWGIGCTAEQAVTGQVQQSQWGRNLLGNLLMELRTELRTKGRPEWGYVMQTKPEVSFKRNEVDETVIIEAVSAEEIKKDKAEVDETHLAPVQEQIAIIEAKAEAEKTVEEATALLDLFGK